MHNRPPTLDEAYRAARLKAFLVAPKGCTCTHTTKLLKLRGTCVWCNTYWAARLEIEVADMEARLQAQRARIAQTIERIREQRRLDETP